MAKRKVAPKRTAPAKSSRAAKAPPTGEKPPKAAAKGSKPARKSPPHAGEPAVEAAPRPKPARSRRPTEIPPWFQAEFAEPKELELALAVVLDPGDHDAREQYSNWLEERDSPRGEFLRLERQSETLGSDMLTARLNQLRTTLSGVWLCAMGDAVARVQPLIAKVDGYGKRATGRCALEVESQWGVLDVRCFGELSRPETAEVLRWLASREISPVIRSLALVGQTKKPGTATVLELSALADAELGLPRLVRLELDCTPGAKATYKDEQHERGLFVRLLRKAPALRELITPTAPNSEFFIGPSHPLETLVVHAGGDSQNFIQNLSGAFRFAELKELEFHDVGRKDLPDWKSRTTPAAAYEGLLRSRTLPKLEKIRIHSASLTPDEIKALRAIRKSGVKFEAE